MSRGDVPNFEQAALARFSYYRIMPARLLHDWYIEQWMAVAGIDSNEELRRRTGWSKRKASDLISGEQPYKRDSLNEAAFALSCLPYELLMHPDEAMQIRRWRADVEKAALRLVAENRAAPPSFAGDEVGGSEKVPKIGT